jgi:hypothetical protein
MRTLLAVSLLAFGALVSAPALAADLPQYPDVQVPEVDYGLQGSFYLRGSAALNVMTSHDAEHECGCLVDITNAGYGYSVGAGFGYETGTGLRFDGTLDYLHNAGVGNSDYSLSLRSTIALANVYYDFGFGHGGAAAGGGWGAYLGAGLGGGYAQTHVDGPDETPDGANFVPVSAVMAGVTYDMGSWVADVGYRGLYMPTLTNGINSDNPYYVNGNYTSEVRGTLRYRLQ